MTRSWSHVTASGTRHTLTVSERGVSTSEISKTGPTFAGSYGLSELLGGKHQAELQRRFGATPYAEAIAEIERVLAAWEPPAIIDCAVCPAQPIEVSADLRGGGELPPTDFVDVYTVFSGSIRRCPRCAAYYRFHNDFEYGHEDTDTLTKLTSEQAASAIEPLNAREAAWLRSR